MSGLVSALQIGTKSMLTNQTALSTISHNIANVNTEGYVRQRLNLASEQLNGFGAGVQISSIQQIVDELLGNRVTEQISSVGFNEAKHRYMKDVEVIFGVPNSETSMSTVLNEFFNEMNILSNNPNSSSQKLNVVQRATFVADTLNTMSTEITQAQLSIDQQVDNELVTVNSALEKIHELNQQIISATLVSLEGSNANDLIDERRRQANILAERLNINITEESDGGMRIVTESGRRMVDSSYVQLERIAGTPFSDIGVRSVLSNGTPSSTILPILMSGISTGSLKGMVEVRDTILPDIQLQADELASTMIEELNLLHSQGVGIPPPNSLLSGNGVNISGAGADLTLAGELGLTVPSSFEISVVDSATGQPISTTLAAGGGTTPINIAAGPFSLNDLAVLINGNPDIGGDVTATVTTDADGNPAIQITANNAAHGLVLANNTGNAIGQLGMNNLFTGTDAGSMAVRADIAASPALLATARMRASDGGLSFNDNRNIIEMAQMADTEVSFAAAGTVSAQTDSISGYLITMTGSFAVSLEDAQDRLDFATNLLTDMEERYTGTSGVNMDEELANLLIFQNSFQAAARVVSVMDELLEILVNIV